MTTPSLSKSQTQKFLNHSPIFTSCQTQKATIQKVYHFLLPQCLSQLPPFYHIKKLPQTNTNPSAGLSLDKFYLPILACLCLNHYLTLILVFFNVDRYLPTIPDLSLDKLYQPILASSCLQSLPHSHLGLLQRGQVPPHYTWSAGPWCWVETSKTTAYLHTIRSIILPKA